MVINMKCCKLCEIGYIALPAFGIGVLTTLFLPTCAILGLSAIISIAFGAVCLMNKF